MLLHFTECPDSIETETVWRVESGVFAKVITSLKPARCGCLAANISNVHITHAGLPEGDDRLQTGAA